MVTSLRRRDFLEGRPPSLGTRALGVVLLLTIPAAVRATPRLLDLDLASPLVLNATVTPGVTVNPVPDLRPSPGTGSKEQSGTFDFDLLGPPPPTAPPADESRLRLRRTLLNVHQGMGLGLFALQLGATVTGQLAYSDRFAGGPSTAKYQQAHALFAYSSLVAFGGTALVALLAPSQLEKPQGIDRTTIHQIAMFTAAAAMATQGVLGVVSRSREGYLNQERIATAHLIVSYLSLAATATGIGVFVF